VGKPSGCLSPATDVHWALKHNGSGSDLDALARSSGGISNTALPTSLRGEPLPFSSSEEAFDARPRPSESGVEADDGTLVPQIGHRGNPKDVQDVAQFEHFVIIVMISAQNAKFLVARSRWGKDLSAPPPSLTT
jgi:hypothetical protein